VYTAAVVLCWSVGLALTLFIARRVQLWQRSRERVFEAVDAAEPVPVAFDEDAPFLTRWLALAGFRSPGAATVFVSLTVLGFCAGLACVYAAYALSLVDRGIQGASGFPGGIGDLLMVVVYLLPWLPLFQLAIVPWEFVLLARQRRVRLIEEDLPLLLELLATLGEAGLGFDAALQRILATQPAGRPLADELRQFQVDVLAGRGRVACLRRLGQRVDVTSFTLFISALVQAEQSGAGVAEVLRRQADDLRDRRRENAVAAAAALPVKLLIPLFICFLPRIFVAALGPPYYQFFQMADSVIRTRSLPPPSSPSQPLP
jgi:tight adherence protein C